MTRIHTTTGIRCVDDLQIGAPNQIDLMDETETWMMRWASD